MGVGVRSRIAPAALGHGERHIYIGEPGVGTTTVRRTPLDSPTGLTWTLLAEM